jgi:hypothetical protein
MAIILIIFSAGCALAALLVLAPTMLSSRHNRSQPASEAYEVIVTAQNGREFTSRPYPVEVKAF